MKEPRLLQMMLSRVHGGAENFFEKLATAFHEAAWEQAVVVEPDAACQPGVEREAQLRKRGIRTHAIEFSSLQHWRGLHRLRQTIQDYQPDVILTWMNRASRRAPRHTSAVVVGRLGGYYKLKHYRHCHHLIGISPDIVRHLREGRPAEDVSLIPNFGETADTFVPEHSIRQERGIPDDHRILISLARYHEAKGLDTLIEALSTVPKTTLLLAGSGPLEEELRALTQQLKVTERVHFLGWRRDAQSLLQQADLCVFPSRHEPLGSVTLEAWSNRVPLVSTRSQGPRWLIEHENDGLLVDIDQPQPLAQAIQRVLEDPALRRRLVEAGHEKFQAHYSKEAILKQYRQLFSRLLRERHHRD